jgi:hypothetical protein
MGKRKLTPLAAAGALLAGCAQSPPAYYQAYQPPPQAYYVPPSYPSPAPPPRRYVAPPPNTAPAHGSSTDSETARRDPPRPVSPPSADDCVGWWRICHFL